MALGAARERDLMLFELVERLVEEGLLWEVMAGKIVYPVEESAARREVFRLRCNQWDLFPSRIPWFDSCSPLGLV